MSHPLPQEILDLIIDHLHNQPTTLEACCLVSRAWLQRARKHLFASVEFSSFGPSICLWKKTFPDHANSPAHNTRRLSIHDSKLIPAEDVDTLSTFRNVTHLKVDTGDLFDSDISLVPLHGFSAVIRSLRLLFSSLSDSKLFGLICSLPHLEDLALVSLTALRHEPWASPPTSPRFTGTLDLCMGGWNWSVTHRLFDLPNGLHFKRIVVWLFSAQDIESTTDLVSRCSDTLESLSIINYILVAPPAASIDLSKATKLQEVEFQLMESGVEWITTALCSAGSKNIHRISIVSYSRHLPRSDCQESSDLDSLLDHLWILNPFRLEVRTEPVSGLCAVIARLLPRITRRGVVDVVSVTKCRHSVFVRAGNM